jgi:hypothetical protein
MSERGAYFEPYAGRLQTQGPDHLATVLTLQRLVHSTAPHGLRGADVGMPSDLPPDVYEDGVQLEGDHTELLSDLVVAAVANQDRCVAAFGPDDARTLMSNVLLAHALAAADQLDGQAQDALVIIVDARDGLADLAARSPETVSATDLAVAKAVHEWIVRLTGEEPRW